MKHLLTLGLLAVSVAVTAQERSSISRCINDDGKKLTIKIDIESKDRNVHYERTFDSAEMDREEKEALVRQVQDSLGVRIAVASTPKPPKPPRYESGETWVSNGNRSTGRSKNDDGLPKNVIVAPDGTPYTKTIIEDTENNRLKLRYEYKVDGQEHVFERTINLNGRSESDRQRIIADTERNLGLPARK
ncbi:hypothetical protein [Larkinella soli]|uniref:hypothetical protein n=1 Tax=Larkinella soli TaxID=1770527 RepID=UPI000FFBB428|nr:hypothetical protein [Larkinella soli]